MVRFVQGNLFESGAEVLVNTVNCVGVMGKGIAYQFKRAYPEMHKDYVLRCKRGEVRLGEVTRFKERGKVILNFPTKSHWRASSKLPDISTGLRALRELIVEESVKSIALPPLGCGNGGLEWANVRPLIERELGALANVDIEVYEPVGAFQSKVAREPRLSLGHFLLAALRADLRKPNRLNIQKAAYFFNVFLGEEYFRFTKYRFGPFSLALDPMFRELRDYREFTGAKACDLVHIGRTTKLRGVDADRLSKMLPVARSVAEYCNRNVERLELLSTVHAVVRDASPAVEDDVIERFFSWSKEKTERFTPEDVHDGLAHLCRDGLVNKTLLGYEDVSAPRSASEKKTP